MAIKINPLLKQFYLFLEKNNARIAWENNLLNQHPDLTRAMFFDSTIVYIKLDGYQFIIGAFTWSRTPEGSNYWRALHGQWWLELLCNR